MLVGISFIIIGILVYANEHYYIKTIHGGRIVKRKEKVNPDRVTRYKIMVSIFSLVLGIFRILSSIIY